MESGEGISWMVNLEMENSEMEKSEMENSRSNLGIYWWGGAVSQPSLHGDAPFLPPRPFFVSMEKKTSKKSAVKAAAKSGEKGT